MSALYKHGHAAIHGNLTPMIDIIFLLIVFFVLVSRIVDRDRVEMNLPQPAHALTQKPGEESRVVINVLPDAGGAVRGYRVGGEHFPSGPHGVSAMTQHLTNVYRMNPGIDINVRADRGSYYEHVEPVMHAISTAARAAGVPVAARVNLVVIEDQAR